MAVTTIMEILEVAAGCNPKHESATPSLRPSTMKTLAFLFSESEPMYKGIGVLAVLLLANALVTSLAESDPPLHSTRFLVSYSLATAVLPYFPRDAPIHRARETLHLMPESNTLFRTGFSIMCVRHSQ